MAFAPSPKYPIDLDDDYTLFLVHNSAETKICVENVAWSDEVVILPVDADKPEIWADNGFANISGEMFYYDDVEKNGNGKVFKLKKCARNLAGTHTQYNPPGTWVRGFVVAEHDNQLAEAIINTEDFIGINFDERQKTLDWRIRNLQALEIIVDDYACPDVVLTFTIIETNPTTGIVAEYLVEINNETSVTGSSFRLDFGDGEFTTSALQGTHRYAINSNIDPVVTVTNDKCQLIQTPMERLNPSQPQEIVTEVFAPVLPDSLPSFPDFTLVPFEVPEPQISLPPMVLPCPGDFGLGDFSFPSVIDVNIPSVITVVDTIPPTIVIVPPIPATIVLVLPDSIVALDYMALQIPDYQVNMNEHIVEVDANTTSLGENVFGEEFADLFDAQQHFKLKYEDVGLPQDMDVVPPKISKSQFDPNNYEDVSSSPVKEVVEFSIPKRRYTNIEMAGVETIELENNNPQILTIDEIATPLNTSNEVNIPDFKFNKTSKVEVDKVVSQLKVDLQPINCDKDDGYCVKIVPCK